MNHELKNLNENLEDINQNLGKIAKALEDLVALKKGC